MQRYSDTILNQNGRPVANARVVVDAYVKDAPANLTGISTSTIYATDGGPAVQFVLSDAKGRFSFYAADGRYSLTVTGSGLTAALLSDVTLNDSADEQEALRKLLPSAINPKILVIGSSTAAGAGSSTGEAGENGVPGAKSWVGILAAKMAAQASANEATPWQIVNAAVGGWRTQEVLNSFYERTGNALRAPAVERPDVVVLALTVGNEGILNLATLAEKDAICRQLLRRTVRLNHMCRQIGARLIVTLQYSRVGFTAVEYELVKRLNRELEATDIPTVNFLGAVDDGTGLYRSGMHADGVHPNDAGHAALARTFSLSIFDRANFDTPPLAPMQVARGFTVPAGATAGGPPMQFNTADIGEMPFGSWTMFFRMKNTGQSTSHFAFFAAVSGSSFLRVRNPATASPVGSLALTRQDDVDLIVDTGYVSRTDFAEHSVGVSYDAYTNSVSLYRDGILIGTAANAYPAGIMDFTQFTFGGKHDNPGVNATGYTFRDIALYRVRLTPEQHEEMHRGVFPKSSCEIFAPCHDSTFKSGHRVANLAPTASQLKTSTTMDLAQAKLI